ncbi:MAG: hypothetical protein LBI45_07720 [Bacteroidales bacterium]|jgi:hypothetical protein|nr:hypothetical protein [Bacteroidales bacterium]
METLTIQYSKKNEAVKNHLAALSQINGVKIYHDDAFLSPAEIKQVEEIMSSEFYPISMLKEKYVK